MTVSEKLRLVQGLYSHAEMFGFNWDDDSDWTWHDVACKIADEIDAENAELREQIETLVMYVEADGTRYWVDDDGNQHFDHSAVKDDADELRELARHLYVCLSFCDREDEERGCGFCPYRSASENCEFEQRLLELGVEVDA